MGVDLTIDITTGQRKTILTLLQRHLPGTEAWVYGSRAKWTSRPQSDLDLVVFATPEQASRVGNLREALEESDLPFRVDLFVWDEVPDNFREQIRAEHRVLVQAAKTNTIEGWPKFALGDCIETNYDRYASSDAWAFVNYLDTGNITENRIDKIQYFRASTDKVPSRARRKIKLGDIVYSMVRPNQRHFGIIRNMPENFLVSTGFSVFRGRAGVADTDFIYWFLSQDAIVEYLQTVAEHSTSAYPAIRPSDIEAIEISLPPLKKQRAIAHILGTLDDKIELNRRKNETLEAMARALFKSWFVDFDPVRAKIEGRDPDVPRHILDFFPDQFDDGGIPSGWRRTSLREVIVTLETGKRPRGGVSGTSQGIPSVGAESITKVGDFDFSKTKFVSSEFYSKMNKGHVSDGDVLVYKDGGKPGELRPSATYVSRGFPFEKLCINEHVFRIRTNTFSQQFLYCLLSTDDAFWQMRELATGVAQPGINQMAMKSIAFVIPDNPNLIRFAESIIDPLIDGCNENARQSHALATARDTLLPKLISGDIRIHDTERLLERLRD